MIIKYMYAEKVENKKIERGDIKEYDSIINVRHLRYDKNMLFLFSSYST